MMSKILSSALTDYVQYLQVFWKQSWKLPRGQGLSEMHQSSSQTSKFLCVMMMMII